MNITFHGAAQTVTGSQHLLSLNGTQILLDCGLYQGARAEAMLRNRTFLFDHIGAGSGAKLIEQAQALGQCPRGG